MLNDQHVTVMESPDRTKSPLVVCPTIGSMSIEARNTWPASFKTSRIVAILPLVILIIGLFFK